MFQFDKVVGFPTSCRLFEYTEKDVALYSLSTGLGADSDEEKFVLEERLACPPTFALIAGHFLPWLRHPDTGIDMASMLHGETGLVMHAALPPAGTLRVRQQVCGVFDRGPGKSVSVYFEQAVTQADSEELLATVTGCFVFPRAGVEKRSAGARTESIVLPQGEPDVCVSQVLPATAALLYRLTGDRNLIHVDRVKAKDAGFDAPILHGLCTFGHAGAAALRALCGGDPNRLSAISARYLSPVYPGDTLRTEFFEMAPLDHGFRCVATNRNQTVIDSGRVTVKEAS